MTQEPEATAGTDDTSSVPGYQPTERIDLAQLSRAVAETGEPETGEPGTDDAGSAHEPLGRATAGEQTATPTPPPATTVLAAERTPRSGTTPEPGAKTEPESEPEREAEPEPAKDARATTPPKPVVERETAEIARRLPRPVPLEPSPQRQVTVVDLPVYRLRRPGDLVAAVVSALGIALVLLLAVFAHATTEGVTTDVNEALPSALRDFLVTPLYILEGVATLWLPITIALVAVLGRRLRQVAEGAVAAVVAGGLVWAGNWALFEFEKGALFTGVVAGRVGFIPIIGALAAYLTVMGTTDRRRLVTWTWNLLWLTLVLQVLRNGMTLPGALASVLAGRAIGLGVRYLVGVVGDRAYGEDLVVALRRCGIDPERILRIVDGRPIEGVEPVVVMTDAPIGYVTEDPSEDDDAAAASGSRASSRPVTATTPVPAPSALAQTEPAREPDEEPAPTGRPRTRDLLAQTWDFSTASPRSRSPSPPSPARRPRSHGNEPAHRSVRRPPSSVRRRGRTGSTRCAMSTERSGTSACSTVTARCSAPSPPPGTRSGCAGPPTAHRCRCARRWTGPLS